MIPDRNPPDTWVSVRDHGNPVTPGQKRTPRSTLATPVPHRRQPGGKATGYSAAGPMRVDGPSTTWPACAGDGESRVTGGRRPGGGRSRDCRESTTTRQFAFRAANGRVEANEPGTDRRRLPPECFSESGHVMAGPMRGEQFGIGQGSPAFVSMGMLTAHVRYAVRLARLRARLDRISPAEDICQAVDGGGHG